MLLTWPCFYSGPGRPTREEKKMTGRLSLGSFTTLALVIAAAAPFGSRAADVRPIIKAGIDVGGDTVVSVNVTGGSSSSKSISANEGVFVGGGVSILMDSREFEVELAASYKFSTIAAQNGDIDWTVLPLDALVFYRLPYVRLGGGLTYHLGPTLKGSGAANGLEAKYDDALGFVLQADYMLKNRFNFGARYTNVNYKANSIRTNPTLSATTPATNPSTSGVGFVFSMRF
ncbi:MAG TPA: outer membrane beta-barrel protein [Burkholderiales bacterium]|nr:outer membrane beta-barrel protein [Burkholderiales bacterium]